MSPSNVLEPEMPRKKKEVVQSELENAVEVTPDAPAESENASDQSQAEQNSTESAAAPAEPAKKSRRGYTDEERLERRRRQDRERKRRAAAAKKAAEDGSEAVSVDRAASVTESGVAVCDSAQYTSPLQRPFGHLMRNR